MNKYQRDRELQMPQGETLPYRIQHDSRGREAIDPVEDSRFRLRLTSEPGVLKAGHVVWLRDDEPNTFPLQLRHRGSSEEVWESDPIQSEGESEYYFALTTVTGQALLGATGLQANMPKEARFRSPQWQPLAVPDWARGACFYQIFPDRFYRAGPPDSKLERWDARPTGSGFKGGNLRGITEKLDYLKLLGIGALYLNPIFSSPSNHRYDTTDFYSIDRRLGTEDDLRELVSSAHDRGIRVILDGVFNHVSDSHPFFVDVVERGRSSPYWDWFIVHDWPIEKHSDDYYRAWWGHGHLPQLNLANHEVRDYLIEVGRHWVCHYDLDGWRLDVAGEVPLDFWQRFRTAVRAVKEDAFLLAEVWGDGRPFLQGDSFDATMNYPFRRILMEFLTGRLDAKRTAEYLERLYLRSPREVAQAQYNLLGSHDVSRVRHDLGGDLRLVALAMAMQCAYPGTMTIYYGDELGLDGAGDPACREGFPWHELDTSPLLPSVRELIGLRNDLPVLRHGEFACHSDGDQRIVIERWLGAEKISLSVDRAERTYRWS